MPSLPWAFDNGLQPDATMRHRIALHLKERPSHVPIVRVAVASSPRDALPTTETWDGKRRFRASAVRKVVDEIWVLWSIPSFVCSGDSGGGIFIGTADGDVLVANVSDGGRDCRSHNNNNRLDTRSIQDWISETVRDRKPPIGRLHVEACLTSNGII